MKIQKIAFIFLALALLAVPVLRIYQYENVLAHGKIFKFETMPVDPYDLFRGRYVALLFKAEQTNQYQHPRGPKVYMTLTVNAEGFAELERVSDEPIKGENVITGRWGYNGSIQFPFGHYFMEENAAPEAERVWRETWRRNSGQKTWAQVRVRNGKAVLEGLYIDGVRIKEFLRKPKKD